MSSPILDLALVLLLLACKGVNGQCYLMDADSDCTVCWRTTYSAPADGVGVTQMFPCPAALKSAWVVSPPERMVHMQEYRVSYSLTVDPNEYTVVHQGSHVPHSNIHSCITETGACTPFVANTPGLSTHTQAQKGSLDSAGQITFSTDVELVAGRYTVIAHSRFFVNNSLDASLPKTKYDLAIGTSRTVVRVREKCAEGFFNEREDLCKPCPPGSFNNGGDPGEHICFKCEDLPGSYYQPLAGSTSCAQCPMNTENVFGSHGVNVSDCMCKPDFWSPIGEAGVACEPCPLGAMCEGALQQPVTKDGFWVDRHANGRVGKCSLPLCRASKHSSATKPTKPRRHTRRGRPNSVRRPIRGLAVPSIPSIRTILNTIMGWNEAGLARFGVTVSSVPSPAERGSESERERERHFIRNQCP